MSAGSFDSTQDALGGKLSIPHRSQNSQLSTLNFPSMYALLMAGGGGTRLWPVSTEEKPKQFQAFFDNRSLLRTTYERILPIIPQDHVWIAANGKHSQLIQKSLPELPLNHCILSPLAVTMLLRLPSVRF